MDDKSFEERELVPGTNIPKPRYREYYESDEDYVAYLKDYYSKYFPEIGKESVEVKNASEINESNYPKPIDEHKVDDDILSFDLNVEKEINEPQNMISDEDEFSFIPFDTSAISQEEEKENIEVNEIQQKLENFADKIVDNEKMANLDISAVSNDNDAVEVENITESNNILKSKAKAPMLWQKAKNFFSNIKASLVEKYETASEKFNDYLDNSIGIYDEENVAIEGRLR